MRFNVEDAGIRVEDLGSTNGTYLNGQRMMTGLAAVGGKILVGQSILMVIPDVEA